jgi:uncharacterized protein (TIGR03905 family)
MKYNYTPKGVCAGSIIVDVEDGIIKDVQVVGGCSGNSQGISKLVVGMKKDDVIAKLKDVKCGARPSSCPAQLAEALLAMDN